MLQQETLCKRRLYNIWIGSDALEEPLKFTLSEFGQLLGRLACGGQGHLGFWQSGNYKRRKRLLQVFTEVYKFVEPPLDRLCLPSDSLWDSRIDL